MRILLLSKIVEPSIDSFFLSFVIFSFFPCSHSRSSACMFLQYRFRTITSSFYRGADLVIGVFDLCNSESFFSLEGWVQDARHYVNENVPILIVGNKVDLSAKRVVDEKTARVRI